MVVVSPEDGVSDAAIKLDLGTFLELLREEFTREERSGFMRLSQIPSTHIFKFLKYYKSLQPQEAASLRAALARHALQCVCYDIARGESIIEMTRDETKAYKDYTDSVVHWWSDETEPLKSLTSTAGAQKAGVNGCENILSPQTLEWALSLKGAKANDLRKLVKYALTERFGLRPEKHGGGIWFYRNTMNDLQFEVCVNYSGSMNSQLRCDINIRDQKRSLVFERLSFEQLMGLSFSSWDFILEREAGQKIALFADLVDYVLQFHRRLIVECAQDKPKES